MPLVGQLVWPEEDLTQEQIAGRVYGHLATCKAAEPGAGAAPPNRSASQGKLAVAMVVSMASPNKTPLVARWRIESPCPERVTLEHHLRSSGTVRRYFVRGE